MDFVLGRVRGKDFELSACLLFICKGSKLEGDVFSPPLLIRGRIFVGYMDDYLHCISIETQELVGE